MAELIFIGTGEAFDPELPNTSLLYWGEQTILFDCGYSIPHALWRVTTDPSLLDAIYLTHRHADHSFGLPPLLLWMREAGRERPLQVIGGPEMAGWLRDLLEKGYPGAYPADRCFPIQSVELTPELKLQLGPLQLRNAQSRHGVRNLSVRVDATSHSFCYSGDGAPSEATRSLYAGADVLVHECYAEQPSVAGHASVHELLQLAEAQSIRQLCLLHLGRHHKADVQRAVSQYSGPTAITLPHPGDTVSL